MGMLVATRLHPPPLLLASAANLPGSQVHLQRLIRRSRFLLNQSTTWTVGLSAHSSTKSGQNAFALDAAKKLLVQNLDCQGTLN